LIAGDFHRSTIIYPYSKDLRIFKNLNHTYPKHQLSGTNHLFWPTPAAWPITGNNSILTALKNLCTVLAVEILTA
jgi:hypothetical protein